MTIEYRPTALSFSSASTYKNCQRKWFHTYIDRRELLTTSYPTTLGSFVHEVLEFFYELEPEKRTKASLQYLASILHAEFIEQDDYKMLYLTPEMEKQFKHDAWRYLTSIWDIEDPEKVSIVATEMDFIEELSGTGKEVPFKGQIDRVEIIGTDIVVSDYKTGKLPVKRFMKDKIPQVMLYSAVVKKKLNIMPTIARFIFLTNEVRDYVPTQEVVDAEIDKLADVWDSIHRSLKYDDFPTTPQMLCGWCPHVDVCPDGQEEVKKFVSMGKMKATAPALDILDLRYLLR